MLFEDEDLSLFADHDWDRSRGAGFFCFDDEENASRRVNLRTPLDDDPGPIACEEAPVDAQADLVLSFA